MDAQTVLMYFRKSHFTYLTRIMIAKYSIKVTGLRRMVRRCKFSRRRKMNKVNRNRTAYQTLLVNRRPLIRVVKIHEQRMRLVYLAHNNSMLGKS
jgi:hypothetical protein